MSRKKENHPETGAIVSPLLEWFAGNARDLPWRRTSDPYAIWISEIMLQQTQVKTVIPFFQRWMEALPGISAAAKAKQEKILKLWEGLGYYTRVRNLQKAALAILEQHGGNFPREYEEVLALPGIGRYTAGAICSIAFNLPVPILDGNVIRVLTRVFGIQENPREPKTNARLWELAGKLVQSAAGVEPTLYQPHFSRHSTGHCSHFNQAMMELGAIVCTPSQPQCLICPLARECHAFREGRTQSLPNLGPRIEATARRFLAFLVMENERVLVRQRPAGVVNAHLWEFPNVEATSNTTPPTVAAKQMFGISPDTSERLCTIKHTITRYRITMEVHRIGFTGNMSDAGTNGEWRAVSELRKLAFPSAHRKVADLVLKSVRGPKAQPASVKR